MLNYSLFLCSQQRSLFFFSTLVIHSRIHHSNASVLPYYNPLINMIIISKLGALGYLTFSSLHKHRENDFLRYVTSELCHFHLIPPKIHSSGEEMRFSFTLLVFLQSETRNNGCKVSTALGNMLYLFESNTN